MEKLVVIGGGDIGKAIGGVQLDRGIADVREYHQLSNQIEDLKPEVVVVTAGVSHSETFKDVGVADYRDELTTNLIGSFNAAKACVTHNVKTLIFIASVVGLHGKPNHAGYSASKAGVISLVQSLAHEGYNAYAISPGRVDTKMRERDYPNDTPGSRLEPEKIAEIVQDIVAGKYEPGDNIIIRKIGLDVVVKKVAPTPFKDELAVGEPVTI